MIYTPPAGRQAVRQAPKTHLFKSSTRGAAPLLFPAAAAAAAAARPEDHPGNVPASQASSKELSVSPNTCILAAALEKRGKEKGVDMREEKPGTEQES